MTTISTLAAVLNGLVQNQNIAALDLITNSVWVGGTSSAPSIQVTPTLLNSFLTALTAGTGISVTGTAPTQTVAVDSTVVRTAGTNAFTAAQSMGGNKLTSLASGTTSTDAVNYGQVLLTSGANAATGALSMGSHQINNVSDPTSAQDAATKNYVDTHAGSATTVTQTFTSGVALTANTSYLVRMALTGETAGSVYLADASSAVANSKFWAIGIASGGASGISIGGTVSVTRIGTWTLGSSDTAFSSSVVGLPVWLNTSGTFTTTAPTTSGYAAYKVGIVQTTSSILMGDKQVTGIN